MGADTPAEDTLTVARAYPKDTGRAIARVDPDAMRSLDLDSGDVVELEGTRTTVARVRQSDRENRDADAVHIDGWTRQNAGVEPGADVQVRKVAASPADRIALAPPPESDVSFAEGGAAAAKRQIGGRPLVEGDGMTVRSSTDHPFLGSPGTAIPMVVAETVPDGPVLVTGETAVEIVDPDPER